jgi:dolichol-phosphate mannosyltransferase
MTPPVPPRLAVVIPCYNEAANVAPMVERLEAALAGIAWEAIFVDDDSPDGTAARAKAIAARDPRVRCIRRIGRRGLASACVEGILSTAAPFVAVIDGDLQHDETILPRMLAVLEADQAMLKAATWGRACRRSAALSPMAARHSPTPRCRSRSPTR